MADPQPFRLLIAGVSWPLETFITRLIHGLAAAGMEVTIASKKNPPPDWAARQHVQFLRIPAANSPWPVRLLHTGLVTVRALFRAPGDFRRFAANAEGGGWHARLQCYRRLMPFAGKRWNLIYFPWNSGAIMFDGLFELRCPVVVSCRGSQINLAPHDPNRAQLREALATTFRHAAAVHCVSEAIRNEATQYGLDPAKARVIHPAVDPDFFQPAATPPPARAGLRLITTGSLVWVKGHEYALSAVRRLVDRGVDARLDIIGDGEERARVLYTIHDLNLADRVRLLGRLHPEAVRDRLREADVFVLSSVSEGISNAAIEAMACGLPVVTTDCGGMSEAVSHGVEGLVVPVRDPEAMAGALAALAADPALRAKLGRAARERVLRQFDLKHQIKSFVTLLTDAARK